jgi:hypothetical protein
MDIRRTHLPTVAALAAAAVTTLPAIAASPPVTAGSEGAAEHAALPQRAFVWSLIRSVGREGAAEHHHLP